MKECHRVLLQQGDTSKKLEISFKKPTCMNKEQAKFLDIHSTYSMEGNLWFKEMGRNRQVQQESGRITKQPFGWTQNLHLPRVANKYQHSRRNKTSCSHTGKNFVWFFGGVCVSTFFFQNIEACSCKTCSASCYREMTMRTKEIWIIKCIQSFGTLG